MLTRCLNGKAQCPELPRLAQPSLAFPPGWAGSFSQLGWARLASQKACKRNRASRTLQLCKSDRSQVLGRTINENKFGHGQKNLTSSLLRPSCESESDNRSLWLMFYFAGLELMASQSKFGEDKVRLSRRIFAVM
jgi:hypothetical protein